MNFYSLLGYRSFKSEREIKEIVAEYHNSFLIESVLEVNNVNLMDTDVISKAGATPKRISPEHVNTLKIFQNKNQQTWIASTNGYAFCLLDDIEIDIQKGLELIKWVSKISDIKSAINIHESKRSPDRVGLIDFGDKHKNWYYSKRLLNDDEMARTYVQGLIISGSSS